MAHIFLKNSLNDKVAVKINLSFVRHYDTNAMDGDPRWLLEIATTYPSVSGTSIPPCYINDISSDNTKLDTLIEEAVAKIGAQVDWEPLINDRLPPEVIDVQPSQIGQSVPIESNVRLDIKDSIPSAGLDLSEAKVSISNGVQSFDITESCEIEGDPFWYIITWEPPFREYKYYE